jgi:hypothetical protein
MTTAACWCGGRIGIDETTDDPICLDSVFHDPVATGRRDGHSVLYIAGPMTGHPENNYPVFMETQRLLEGVGYSVVNPASFGVPSGGRVHYVDILREDLRAMLDCHGVAVLDGWWESHGARNEINVAGLLKMPVRPVEEWLTRARMELAS